MCTYLWVGRLSNCGLLNLTANEHGFAPVDGGFGFKLSGEM